MSDNSQPHPPPQILESNERIGTREELTIDVSLVTSTPTRRHYFYRRPAPEKLEIDDTKSYPCTSERYRQGLDKKKSDQ